jgi:beta-galactosidase
MTRSTLISPLTTATCPKGGDPQREWGSTAEAWMNFYAARPWLAGAFVWTGFDYRGEPTPYSWPGISSPTGILDTCGFPKDSFYFLQSVVDQRAGAAHLAALELAGQGRPEYRSLGVHSNFDGVELFLNGQSLGKRDMPRLSHLEWQVPYQPGKLEARGYKNGQVAATTVVETTGAPASLVLTTDRKSMAMPIAEDVAVINVSARGRRGPRSSHGRQPREVRDQLVEKSSASATATRVATKPTRAANAVFSTALRRSSSNQPRIPVR